MPKKAMKKKFEKYKKADIIQELPDEVSEKEQFKNIEDVEIPKPIKDPVSADDLSHRIFTDYNFWKKIPAFKNITRKDFMDISFQNSNSATKVEHLNELLENIVSKEFLDDVNEGMRKAPMNLRLSPYILSLIEWEDPYNDALRRQFVPVASTKEADHPKLTLDSLNEQDDSPTEGLVHRYFDKALFLPLDVCPVYCRYCTRSYAIGSDTDLVTKLSFKPIPNKWNKAFAYIASRPELEDIVISGGDAYMLRPHRIRQIGDTLLAIPHVRRIRFATKGLAVLPMKIISDHDWTDAICDVVDKGRDLGKEVVIHTHFNHTNEITDITKNALDVLFKRGITTRNQSVLIKGVNDSIEEMTNLVRQLSYLNIQPYYVYQHDMVSGVEELRTSVKTTLEIERNIRGATAGFNTPTFVMDAPGGGGKRDVHSFDYYDEITGISVYRSPSVDDSKIYLYYDPIHSLPEEGKKLWSNPNEHSKLIDEAITKSGYKELTIAS